MDHIIWVKNDAKIAYFWNISKFSKQSAGFIFESIRIESLKKIANKFLYENSFISPKQCLVRISYAQRSNVSSLEPM